jgi:hypothetical protein
MVSRRMLLCWVVLAAAAPAAAAPPAAAPGSVPQPPHCPLLARPPARDHAIPGTALVARDPYGGLLARGRSFDFRVRGPRATLDAVARVEWALDGVTAHVDDRGPSFAWFGFSSVPGPALGATQDQGGIPAGDHTIRVTVVPKSGTPASVEFALTATDCQYVQFQAFLPRAPGVGATELFWDSAFESDAGVALTAVAARGVRNIVSALPAGVRGRAVGTLSLGRPGRPSVRRRLRAPRRGGVLLRDGALRATLRPGAREFLTVTGLPAATQSVSVVLRGPGTRLVHSRDPCRMALVRGVLRAGRARASAVHGGAHAC